MRPNKLTKRSPTEAANALVLPNRQLISRDAVQGTVTSAQYAGQAAQVLQAFALDAAPLVAPVIKIAVVVLTAIAQAQVNREDLLYMGQRVHSVVEAIGKAVQASGTETQWLSVHIKGLERTLLEVSSVVEKLLKGGWLRQALQSKGQAETISRCNNKLNHALQDFSTKCMIELAINISTGFAGYNVIPRPPGADVSIEQTRRTHYKVIASGERRLVPKGYDEVNRVQFNTDGLLALERRNSATSRTEITPIGWTKRWFRTGSGHATISEISEPTTSQPAVPIQREGERNEERNGERTEALYRPISRYPLASQWRLWIGLAAVLLCIGVDLDYQGRVHRVQEPDVEAGIAKAMCDLRPSEVCMIVDGLSEGVWGS